MFGQTLLRRGELFPQAPRQGTETPCRDGFHHLFRDAFPTSSPSGDGNTLPVYSRISPRIRAFPTSSPSGDGNSTCEPAIAVAKEDFSHKLPVRGRKLQRGFGISYTSAHHLFPQAPRQGTETPALRCSAEKEPMLFPQAPRQGTETDSSLLTLSARVTEAFPTSSPSGDGNVKYLGSVDDLPSLFPQAPRQGTETSHLRRYLSCRHRLFPQAPRQGTETAAAMAAFSSAASAFSHKLPVRGRKLSFALPSPRLTLSFSHKLPVRGRKLHAVQVS